MGDLFGGPEEIKKYLRGNTAYRNNRHRFHCTCSCRGQICEHVFL